MKARTVLVAPLAWATLGMVTTTLPRPPGSPPGTAGPAADRCRRIQCGHRHDLRTHLGRGPGLGLPARPARRLLAHRAPAAARPGRQRAAARHHRGHPGPERGRHAPACLPSLLGQDYPGTFAVILVDDDSTDGTAKVAAALGEEAGWRVTRPAARPATANWPSSPRGRARLAGPARSGRWPRASARPARSTGYLLCTDADIAYRPGTVAALARASAGGGFTLVSQMALLRTATRWEKLLIPAFVYFFAQLYPFRRVGVARSRTAAAAGGCMLIRAAGLDAAGGLDGIRAARIDDVALGRLLKRAGGRCWLGVSTDVLSLRPYDRLADIWDMVARSAYTQLRYSLPLTLGAIAGLAWLYLLPPVAAVTGAVLLLAGNGGSAAGWLDRRGTGGVADHERHLPADPAAVPALARPGLRACR